MNRRDFIKTSAAASVGSVGLPPIEKRDKWGTGGWYPGGSSRMARDPSEFYVATTGDDSHPGTLQKPFRTLVGARNTIRSLRGNREGPVTVFVRAGTYYQPEPLIFWPQDSGSAQSPILYTSHPGEMVTISGGRRLNSCWKPYRDGIMMCSLPEAKSGKLSFTQLFVNGKRQIRARYPNYDANNPLVSGNGYIDVGREEEEWPASQFHYDPATFTKKRWVRPQEAVVHIFPLDYWGNLQWQVRDVDWEHHAVKLGWGGFQVNELVFGRAGTAIGRSQLYHGAFASRFFVENVFEELDAPGEWFLDQAEGTLYYFPESGLDLNRATFEVPVLKRIVEFRGSQQEPVKYVSLSGFRIAHTASTFLDEYEAPSSGDWTIHRGGAVYFEGAEDCALQNCFLDAVGGNAVFINDYNRRIRVSGNRITEAGDSAICLVGSRQKLQGTNRALPAENLVSNNLIRDCGIFGKQIAGVFISVSEKNTVSHNLIYNLPRAGICINDGWGGGHVIEFNEIHDTVRETTDHGPFNSWGRGRYWCFQQSHNHVSNASPRDVSHASGYQDGNSGYIFAYAEEDGLLTTIRNNFFHEEPKKDKLGIDLDDGSSHYHIYNNLCIGMSIKLREGDYRTIENNVFINPSNPPGLHQGYEQNHDCFIRNIIVTSSTLSGWAGDRGDTYQVLSPPRQGPIAAQIDFNLFSSRSGQFLAFVEDREKKVSRYTLTEWQSLGYDLHSIYGDPMFVDAENGDYRVKPGSPALRLGFKNFDIKSAGLLPEFPKRWTD